MRKILCINDVNCALIKKGEIYDGYPLFSENQTLIGWNIPGKYHKYPVKCCELVAKTLSKNIKTI